MTELVERVQTWLQGTYGGLVTLDGAGPVVQTERATLFGCRYAAGQEPMLSATICAPADGAEPFPVANSDPLDVGFNLSSPSGARPWRWRINARNCVIATDAAVDHRPASALPWRPEDEAPGWWDRLLAGHFPDAETSECSTWEQAAQAIMEGGAGSRGVVWLQRRLDGRALTGHLLYADFSGEDMVFLDGQRGTLAALDDNEVDRLVLARFRRSPIETGLTLPWEAAAAGFAEAVEKATQWLSHTYQGEARLVSPDPADESERGWLFACTSRRFLESGDWRDQMLDAAVVVPKAAGAAPFGLPNRDPWTWLRDWNAGKPGLPEPPSPSDTAAWFGSTIERLGATVTSVHAHRDWAGALGEITALPARARALIWVRRRDSRDRETVGQLMWAVNDRDGVQIIDPLSDNGEPLIEPAPLELRIVHVD